MHFSNKDGPTKTEIANYWHDSHAAELQGAAGAALTDAAVFFLRFVGAGGLGQFIAAGTGRETHLKVDTEAVAEYVTGDAAPPAAPPATPTVDPAAPPLTPQNPPPAPPAVTVSGNAGVHVNVEIHIAADAKPATIEEMFRNMRKYVLDLPPVEDE